MRSTRCRDTPKYLSNTKELQRESCSTWVTGHLCKFGHLCDYRRPSRCDEHRLSFSLCYRFAASSRTPIFCKIRPGLGSRAQKNGSRSQHHDPHPSHSEVVRGSRFKIFFSLEDMLEIRLQQPIWQRCRTILNFLDALNRYLTIRDPK